VTPTRSRSCPALADRFKGDVGVVQETPQLSDSGLRLSVAASAYSSRKPVQFTTLLAGLWSSAGGRLEMTTVLEKPQCARCCLEPNSPCALECLTPSLSDQGE